MPSTHSGTWRRRIVLFLAPLLLLLIGYKYYFVWPPEIQVRDKQKRFLEAIEKAKYVRCRRLLDDDYADRWDFEKSQIVQAIRDVRRNFTRMEITWTETKADILDESASLEGKIRLDGQGHTLSDMVLKRANDYDSDPFTFTWKKTGAWPWSWKMTQIDHPAIERPPDYEPGQLGGSF